MDALDIPPRDYIQAIYHTEPICPPRPPPAPFTHIHVFRNPEHVPDLLYLQPGISFVDPQCFYFSEAGAMQSTSLLEGDWTSKLAEVCMQNDRWNNAIDETILRKLHVNVQEFHSYQEKVQKGASYKEPYDRQKALEAMARRKPPRGALLRPQPNVRRSKFAHDERRNVGDEITALPEMTSIMRYAKQPNENAAQSTQGHLTQDPQSAGTAARRYAAFWGIICPKVFFSCAGREDD